MATMPAQQSGDQDVDAISRLEERIQRAVNLVTQLRQELADSRRDNARLSEELQAMRTERQQVRGRLEKLLDHIDTLGAA